jgi:hypothetical protein
MTLATPNQSTGHTRSGGARGWFGGARAGGGSRSARETADGDGAYWTIAWIYGGASGPMAAIEQKPGHIEATPISPAAGVPVGSAEASEDVPQIG